MPLPSSGQPISISDVLALNPTGFSPNLDFLNSQNTPGQASGTGTGSTAIAVANQRASAPNLDNFHGKSYYQANIYGNCNNGNCVVNNCNCGDANCQNCLNCNAINCSNCDTKKWIQNDCNCNCTTGTVGSVGTPLYNCTQVTHSYACACTDCTNCW